MSTQVSSAASAVEAVIVPIEPVKGPRADRPVRRSFSDAYKQRIVAEYDSASRGEKGAILRRDRLWDAHIFRWRAAIESKGLDEMTKRGRPEHTDDQRRIRELEKQVESLEAKIAKRDEELEKTNAALEILGKGVAFLEALSSKNAL